MLKLIMYFFGNKNIKWHYLIKTMSVTERKKERKKHSPARVEYVLEQAVLLPISLEGY